MIQKVPYVIQYIIFIYNMKKDIKKFLNFSNMLADEARLISLKYFKKKMKLKIKRKLVLIQ